MSTSRQALVSGAVVVLLVGGTTFALWKRGRTPQPKTAEATLSTLTEVREFTGRMQAVESARLGFESGGTVREVLVKDGDAVEKGERLVVLDTRTSSLELEKAFAEKTGAEDAARLEVTKTEQTLTNTVAKNATTLEKTRQTVRNAKKELDQSNEVWQQTVRESGDESSAARTKYLAVLTAQSSYTAVQKALSEAMTTAKYSADTAAAAVESAETALAAIERASRSSSGRSALEATEELARVRLSRGTLLSPFAGVVTEVTARTGEFIAAGAATLTVQSLHDLEIVADVSETDRAKIAPNMPATVTFDALGTETSFLAAVTKIRPAATMIEGVPTYRVTAKLQETDERISAGFTANVSVTTATRENVVSIPRRAVTTEGGAQRVRVLTRDGSLETREVKTGITDADGRTEITSGLTAGERVALPTSEKR